MTVTIIRAENLPQGIQAPVVNVRQGDKKFTTAQGLGGTSPHFDEECAFQVFHEYEPVVFDLIDLPDTHILSAEVPLEQPTFGQIIPLQNYDRTAPQDPRLLVKVQFQPNREGQLTRQKEFLEAQLRENIGTIKQVKSFIDQLSSPFGFLAHRALVAEHDVIKADLADE